MITLTLGLNSTMEVKRYCVVSSVGVVFEQYGWHREWPAACAALRQACADHPMAGCRLLLQKDVVAVSDSKLERRNSFMRMRAWFRG